MITFDDFEAQVKALFKIDTLHRSEQVLADYRTDLAREGARQGVSVYYITCNKQWPWSISTVYIPNVWGVGGTLTEAYEDFRRQLVLSRNDLCARHDRLLGDLP